MNDRVLGGIGVVEDSDATRSNGMTTASTAQPLTGGTLEAEIRTRINSLSYLPTTAAVAMKFVELGKDFNAEPDDYARVVSSDSSLSAKILAMANSSWAGVRNKVTNVKTAVNLLGLGTVRTLGISYCVAGLHNELKLNAAESQLFWEAALCKAAAAKTYMARVNERKADEAFVTGLFQDFALPVMYSIGRGRYLQAFGDADATSSAQRQKERDLFNMDHTEVGRLLAQQLELPDLFVDCVAFHHNLERMCELLEDPHLAEAAYTAALLPHLLNVWHREDAETLAAFVSERAGVAGEDFLADVQREFEQMYKYLNDDAEPNTDLSELLQRVAKEAADNTTQLVNTVNEFMRQAAEAGMAVHDLVDRNEQLEDRASRDPLTGVLNREMFTQKAKEALAKAARYRTGYALAYFDIDQFKLTNDTFGHEAGDAALKLVAESLKEVAKKQHIVGRPGGDEFVLFMSECTDAEALSLVEKVVKGTAETPIRMNGAEAGVTLSAGMLYFKPASGEQEFDTVLGAADKLMYQAKRAGGNRTESRVIEKVPGLTRSGPDAKTKHPSPTQRSSV